ncbi:proline-rich protein 23A-like [Dipodomys merriami]|uniref:proline-rich protein 23A-like n=1 Tax=Dipodomys merriami TaxID=94247 RepID=UPI003855BD8F
MMDASTTPWWAPEPAGPSPAKRRRLDQPGPPPQPPSLEDPSKGTPAHADAQAGLTSLVVLATGCALQVPLGHVDLVLEPPPASVLTVDLQGHRLILIPQDLLGLTPQGQPGVSSDDDDGGGLLLDSLLDARPEDVVVQQGLCYEPVPEVARQEEAYAEDVEEDIEDAAEPDFLQSSWSSPEPGDPSPQPRGSSAAPTPDPDSHRAQSIFNLDFHLLRSSVPGSPLQPLPPSPSPSSNPTGRPSLPVRPAQPHRPASKARRRLF